MKIDEMVEKIPIAGCWIWLGGLHHSGYGRSGRNQIAHRAVYSYLTGKTLTPDQKLCHHCDVKCCVNPDHLFVGTQKDNIDDMDNKGRRVKALGERNGRAKLTEQDVLSIREDSRTVYEIAISYGIGKSQVSNIKNRISWKQV